MKTGSLEKLQESTIFDLRPVSIMLFAVLEHESFYLHLRRMALERAR
jgi:hypothetical protein